MQQAAETPAPTSTGRCGSAVMPLRTPTGRRARVRDGGRGPGQSAQVCRCRCRCGDGRGCDFIRGKHRHEGLRPRPSPATDPEAAPQRLAEACRRRGPTSAEHIGCGHAGQPSAGALSVRREDVRWSIVRIRRSVLWLRQDHPRGCGLRLGRRQTLGVKVQADTSVDQDALAARRQRSHPRPRQCLQISA
jgi:hypothetical protein